MKKLMFDRELFENDFLSVWLMELIGKWGGNLIPNFLSIKGDVFSDIPSDSDLTVEEFKEYENIEYFINFIMDYLFNILAHNSAVSQRKDPPYDVILMPKVSFEEKKFQLYLFLDDKIFGLVVGTKFKNVLSLIQCIFPIMGKTNFSSEIRFFPISRMEYILGE